MNSVYSSERTTVRLVALALAVASAAILVPLGAPLLLAAWTADALGPLMRSLQRSLGGRRRGAAALVVILVVTAMAPLVGAGVVVVAGVRDLLEQVRAAVQGHGTLSGALLGGTTTAPPTFREWLDLASRHGANAWRVLMLFARASTSVLLGLVVFVVALYAMAASGFGSYRWLAHHTPLAPRTLGRFTRAFRETGRGLIIGGGGTALVQGLVATVTYVALGIPRALLLGPLTAVCGVVPVVGTGLIWVPLAIELASLGDYLRCGVVVTVGVGVHSLVDSFVRPVLTRRGRLKLPTAVVLISMLGGVAAFGAFGALLGPLIVRLAVEALEIARDDGLFPNATHARQTLT